MSNRDHRSSREPSLDASRRDFLTVAAGGLAAAALGAGAGKASAREVRFQDGGPAAKAKPRTPIKEGETIRMGIIGVGGMGSGHCAAFPKLSRERGANVQIVAIADPWPRNLDSAHKRLTTASKDDKGNEVPAWQPGVEVAKYADYTEMLKRPDIHAVLIASPEHWHAQHACDAILAGKDVYSEKPMALNLNDALRMHKTVKANPDMILQVGTQKMALPSYLEATKMVKSGLIGVPTCSQTSYCRNSPKGEWNYYHVDPKWTEADVDWAKWCGPLGAMKFDPYVLNRWRRFRKTSTGIIGDLLVHMVTPMLMAIEPGFPVRVCASGGHLIDKDMENHDTVNILAEFERGHQMMVMGATNNDTGLTPLIRGPKGNIEVNDGSVRFTPQSPYAEELEEEKPKLANIGDDQDQHRVNWLTCLRTRTQPPADVETGLRCMVLVDLATRSLWEGGVWTFDPHALTAKRM